MPGRRDLGLHGWALAVVLLVGPVVLLLAHRRWRIAEARREEVRRLAALAAEDAERAEEEARWQYMVGYVGEREIEREIGRPRCAVCFSPTSTRCSRCKAFRYCSGRCQIIHWRQGHKEECHPPHVDDDHNTKRSSTNSSVGCAKQSDLCDKLRIEGSDHAQPAESFSQRPVSPESSCSSEVLCKDDGRADEINPSVAQSTPDVSAKSSHYPEVLCKYNGLSDRTNTSVAEHASDVKPDSSHSSEVLFRDDGLAARINTSATECTSDSFASSSPSSPSSTSFSTFSSLSDDVFFSKELLPHHRARLKEPLFCDTSNDSSGKVVDVSQTKFVKSLPSEVVSGSLFVNNSVACSDGLKKSEKIEHKQDAAWEAGSFLSSRSVGAEPTEGRNDCGEVPHSSGLAENTQDDNSVYLQFSDDESIQLDAGSPLQASSKLSSKAENSSNETSMSENTVQPEPRYKLTIQTAKSTCLSGGRSTITSSRGRSVCLAYHETAANGDHRVSSDTHPPVEKPPIVPIEKANKISVLNGDSDLKTSVRRVVQQCRSLKFSRNYSSGFGTDLSGKQNNKVLFPYDLFVKLYNCDKVDLRPCGLINCGNSCYANVVLQCLAFTRPLAAYLLEELHGRRCSKADWCFMCEFEHLLQKARQGKSPLSPVAILSHIEDIGRNLGRGREEDAHEFLRYIVDAMQSVCLKEAGKNIASPPAEETTLIQLIFGGYLQSKVKCMRCQGKSERHDRIMDLTVEIQGEIGSLEEALVRFTATEVLDGENKYKCNRCKSYERAKKKLTISEAPNVLTIALKRFQSGKFGKLNKAVRFPEYLNLAPYMSRTDDKSPVYRLYAVVVHLDVMNAAFSGHYVCYVKNTQGKWYKMDDSKVKPVSLEKVLSKGAYMLLYARCSPRAPSLLRRAMPHGHDNLKRSKSKLHPSISAAEISKPRSSSSVSHPDSSAVQNRSRQYPFCPSAEPAYFEPFDLFDERFMRLKADSSSDSSSLFSCSDEGSWSTDSTRNSTSTEEFSDYIFGEPGRSSPYRFVEDSDGFCFTSSPSTSNFSYSAQQEDEYRRCASHEKNWMEAGVAVQDIESLAFLKADTPKICRNLTKQVSSSNSKRSSRSSEWVDPHEVKSSVAIRRCSKDRTTQ